MQKEVILALDISTSYVGWCLVDNLGTLVAADAIDLKKMVDMFSKARVVHQTFARLNNENLIKRIVVEENLQAFRPGFSSAKTICTLARFNGMVSLLANQATEIVPEFVNVNHARKSIGLKIDRKSDIPTKEQILPKTSVEGGTIEILTEAFKPVSERRESQRAIYDPQWKDAGLAHTRPALAEWFANRESRDPEVATGAGTHCW